MSGGIVLEYNMPLISPLSRKYYTYASEKSGKIHHRAGDIRICLEYICDEIIIEFVPADDKANWISYDLHKKLKAAKSFVSNTTINNLIKAKIVGNEGVHKGEEGQYSKTEIDNAITAIRQFSMEVFLSYFKNNGFGNFEKGSWVPTVFSTLPPIYRVEILKEYYKSNNSIFVIDKISKALLKSGMDTEAKEFLAECFDKKELTSEELNIFMNDLELLKKSFHLLNIADDLEMSKRNFNNLLPAIKEDERDAFVCLVSMVVNGHSLK